MFFEHYINSEFTGYLNRYVKGILLLKDALKEIQISYELSEAFSNHTCRFCIDIDFLDFDSLSEAQKLIANQYFHNMWQNTGSKFVSFSYKPRRSTWVNFDEIASFITHYAFAKDLFEGAISSVLPSSCSIEIASLKGEPIFLYADRFSRSFRYSREGKDLEVQYRELYGRDFDFDCTYHNMLKEAADKHPKLVFETTISDKELKEINACYVEDLRRFVLSENIPFNIENHATVVDLIRIDIGELKKKILSYNFSGSYLRINVSAIIRLIDQKEKEHEYRQSQMKDIRERSGIKEGDFVIVERDQWEKECNDLGVVKSISLRYNDQIQVSYCLLKNDLQESKLPLKETLIENISFSIHSSKVEKEKEHLKKRPHLVSLLQNEGDRNLLFQVKKTRRKR